MHVCVLSPPRIKSLDKTGKKHKPLSLLPSPVFHPLKSNKLIHIMPRLAQTGASLQAKAKEAALLRCSNALWKFGLAIS